jgi:hypothetical protein
VPPIPNGSNGSVTLSRLYEYRTAYRIARSRLTWLRTSRDENQIRWTVWAATHPVWDNELLPGAVKHHGFYAINEEIGDQIGDQTGRNPCKTTSLLKSTLLRKLVCTASRPEPFWWGVLPFAEPVDASLTGICGTEVPPS